MVDLLAVFDLDGTLVDTAPDLIDSTNHVLKGHGFPAVPNEVMLPYIGHGARQMIRGALKANDATLSEEAFEKVFDEYFAHYSSRIARYSRPFAEMLKALDDLDAAGVKLGVCTNKREDLARQLLEELAILDRFVVVTGGDTFDVCKPDPAHLFGTIEMAGFSPDQTVYVGDSRVDRETARAARIPFVGLTYGYSDTPMSELSPERLVKPGEDVAEAILALAGTRPGEAAA